MKEIQRLRDAYARRAERGLDRQYSLAERANQHLFQSRERAILAALERHSLTPLHGRRILDIGCGSGEVMADLVRLGATPSLMWGIDLLDERICRARENNPLSSTMVGNAAALPYAGESFDIALQFTLMSSVLDAEMRRQIARETLRVLQPAGAVLWYDFIWNPMNPDVRGVGLSEVKNLYPG